LQRRFEEKGFMNSAAGPKQEAVVRPGEGNGSSALSGLLVLPPESGRANARAHDTRVLYLVGVGKNPEAVDESEIAAIQSVMRSG